MEHYSIKNYVLGYLGSIFCTLTAYVLVYTHVFSGHEWPPHEILIPIVIALAVAQLLIQLYAFLHLGKHSASDWSLLAFLYTALLVVILAGGSLWIMYHLNYNMMLVPADGTGMQMGQ